MLTPHWILDTFAAVMIAVAVLSAARLALARPGERGAVAFGIDIAHLVMSVAMAGALTAKLPVPGPMWTVSFAVLTAWFAVVVGHDAWTTGTRALAGGHCAPHLVHSAAMLYMSLALTTSAGSDGAAGGMDGTPGSGLGTLSMPTLALVFAVTLIGYGVWDIDRLSSRRPRLALALDGVAVPLAGAAVAPWPAAAEPPWPAAAEPSTAVAPWPTAPEPSAAAAATTTAAYHASAAAPRAASAGRPGIQALLLAPEVTVGCRIAMGVTMALMLLIMI
jgi:hypothetical protein